DLILAILEESLPEMLVPLHALKENVGKGTATENLTEAVQGLVRFHRSVMGMVCSLIVESELRERFRRSLAEGGRGPERGIRTLAEYIDDEKALGRIRGDVKAKAAARVLMASSFFHVFTEELLGSTGELHAKSLVRLAIGET
ncbi:MAG TPA: hypothetical protein VL495_07110, partial [Edaphobacter sp.]|nr:hypothetical protein [Edaphobacter sp.]